MRESRRPGCIAWIAFGGWWSLAALLPVAVLVRMAGRAAVFGAALATDWEKVLWSPLECAATAVAAVLLAAFILLSPGGRRGAAGIRVFYWTLLALPGSLLAFALLKLCQLKALLPLYDSPLMVVVAGVARFFPLAYFALAVHLRAVPRAEWEAADFALSWRRGWLAVKLPLARPGLIAGAASVALFSSQELAAAVFLAYPGREPLLVRIYNLLHYDPERDVLGALSLYHIAGVLAVVLFFLLFGEIARRR